MLVNYSVNSGGIYDPPDPTTILACVIGAVKGLSTGVAGVPSATSPPEPGSPLAKQGTFPSITTNPLPSFTFTLAVLVTTPHRTPTPGTGVPTVPSGMIIRGPEPTTTVAHGIATPNGVGGNPQSPLEDAESNVAASAMNKGVAIRLLSQRLVNLV